MNGLRLFRFSHLLVLEGIPLHQVARPGIFQAASSLAASWLELRIEKRFGAEDDLFVTPLDLFTAFMFAALLRCFSLVFIGFACASGASQAWKYGRAACQASLGGAISFGPPQS